MPRFFILTMAILVLSGPLAAQCSTGASTLGINGFPQPGATLTFGLTGTPLDLVFMMGDTTPGPVPSPWGPICLGPNLVVFVDAIAQPLYRVPSTGTFLLPLTIPDDLALVGNTYYFQGAVVDPTAPFSTAVSLSNGASMTIAGPQPVNTIFFESFETGIGFWFATNGLWQVGTPASGPLEAFGGLQCAATDLAGDYPTRGADTRLVSPLISLPSVSADDEIRANYRMWFLTEDALDECTLEARVFGQAAWTPVASATSGRNEQWTQFSADLTAFAGQTVELAYHFVSNDNCCPISSVGGPGVFIDDIHVFHGVPFLEQPEDWESGLGHWWACDNGLWEAGTPGPGGPTSTPSGTSCVATVLDGDYPSRLANSRLISPPFYVATATTRLFFQQWFDMHHLDVGTVQASTDGGATWTSIGGPFTGTSAGWSQTAVQLGSYAGSTIKIAFNFTSTDGCCPLQPIAGPGWFIDDVRIVP